MTKRVLIVDDEPSVDDDFDGLWWDAASSARRRPALRSAAGTGSKACLRYVYCAGRVRETMMSTRFVGERETAASRPASGMISR